MKLTTSSAAAAAAALLCAGLVAGCGGGGGDAPAAPAPAATTTKISGVAADGLLQGATACYDLNDNGKCDSGEPSATTDAAGKFSFDVAIAAAGLHRVVVDVPATAIDKDNGVVGTAFTLMSPATGSASAAVFASPLTTLVQAHIDNTGVTVAVASDFIKAQAGLAVSPLTDFTATSNADTKLAATVARLVVLTTQQQSAAVASVTGTTDISGATISAADLAKAVRQAIIEALPTVAAAAADPAVASATGAALQTALTSAATAVVAQTGLTAESAAAAVGVAKLPPDTAAVTPVATASLSALRYTDVNNWYYRTLESSAADNTPDANGKLRYYEVHKESASNGYSANGVVQGWGFATSRLRTGDTHWNGSAWVACPLGSRNLSSPRDPQGRNSYDHCDGFELGTGVRSTVDLTGKSIATVFKDTIRKFPGGASGVNYANWGPNDPTVFGNATFPANSKLYYQANTVTKTAIAYDVQASNVVTAYSAQIAAGGDARSTSGLACAASVVTATTVTTLEDLVARNPGKPCTFGKNVTGADASLEPNEWWSNSTASLGVLSGGSTLPAGTGNWYSTDLRLRVAFTGTGNGTVYYSCLSRASNGSSRNCTQIGTGTYSLQTLGDGRVMTFTGLPASVQKLGFTRVFVERGGKVYFGFQNPNGQTTNFLRLNLEALNAVFAPLGLPPVIPVTRASDFSAAATATAATLKGAWGLADDSGGLVFRFGDNGRFLMAQADPANTQAREQSGAELGYFALDPSTGKYASLLEVDSNLTAGTSHPEAQAGLTVTSTQLTASTGTVIPRMPGGSSGLVGLWALGSATDLAVQHFAFFGNGKVMMIDNTGDTSGGTCTLERKGPPGVEFASYTFNATTGALRVFGKLYDTNGCAGFFDSAAPGGGATEATVTLTFGSDGKTAVVTQDGEDPVTLHRIPAQ